MIDLGFLEDVCPRLGCAVDALGCVPDFDDDTQVLVLKETAETLRKIAAVLDSAAGSQGEPLR